MTPQLLPAPRRLRLLGGWLAGSAAPRLESGAGSPESYSLTVDRDVRIAAADEVGLLHGQRTLRQLRHQYGARLPRLRIEDAPAFPNRGYSLDISRGRVPTLASLKTLVGKLSALKVNRLQLYIEHVFDFGFDPDIGAGSDPLTARDIRELDRHCRARHVELIPCLACFGHMGKALSLPRYRGLAEVEWPARDWESATWRQRLRGATLNPRRPESRRLIRRMLDEFLPLFSSARFNMCGDETYDLGRGVNAGWVRRRGVAALYLEHLEFVRGVAREHGKQLMFWGDVMQQHPESIRRVPRDCIALDWGYERHTDFEKAGRFIRAGIETWVCPSTRGYKVVFNEVEEARANIAGYARTGRRLGASGLLVTDWGDMGHFNLPAASLHGLALGAAMGWNPDSSEGAVFDRAWSIQALGDPAGKAAALFAQAGSAGWARWPLLLQGPDADPPPPEAARLAARQAAACRRRTRRFAGLRPNGTLLSNDVEELAVAAEAMELTAQRLALGPGRARPGQKPALNRRRIVVFIRALESFFRRYARVWTKTSRPAGLKDLARAFRQAARSWREWAKKEGTP
ncbi:MAG TPA: family 20 glycosylhydrolase [Kiritimatiellia bacterium]|nr:family 20 glycosylhydrolase [Kiritimatiellia bacterium]HRZ13263.1 family 20 glycosylhydrolase [Kiritimatiellia bacterium]HSA18712.1 family 20 glycosylhydrolase [Kiritimatiellia bacterium]